MDKTKAVIARFSVLKGDRPKLKPVTSPQLKCAGECTCRCCKR